MTRRDVRRMLDDLGRTEPARPADEFVERVGGRLRAVSGPVASLPSSRRPRVGSLVAVSVAAVAIAVVVALSAQQDERALVVVAAADTTVLLPDGRALSASEGLELPDGAVVRTGPAGHVDTGEDELGPATEGVVRNGRLHASRAPADMPAPTARPVAPAAVAPTPVPARPTPVPSHPPALERLALDCRGFVRADAARVACSWSSATTRDFASYRLVRGESGADEYRVVFQTRDRSQTQFVDSTVETDHVYGYQVEALDATGRVVGAGGPVRVHVTAQSPQPAKSAAPVTRPLG